MLAGVISVIITHEEIGFPSMREPVRLAVVESISGLRVQSRLHARIDPKSVRASLLDTKLDVSIRARKWLESDEISQERSNYPNDAVSDSPSAEATIRKALEREGAQAPDEIGHA